MTFTDTQNKALAAPLDSANVKPPAPGKYGEYIEGWKVIEEANRIFGFDAWDRETIETRCVSERERKIGQQQKDGWSVSYVAKVRVTSSAAAELDRSSPEATLMIGHRLAMDRFSATTPSSIATMISA